MCALLLAALAMVSACRKDTQQSDLSQPPMASVIAGVWHLDLRTSPRQPSMTKPMTLLLHIIDNHGQEVNDAQVSGVLTMKVMDMGATPLQFAAKGNGDYAASAKAVDMAGPWNLAVDVKQAPAEAKANFEVVVGE